MTTTKQATTVMVRLGEVKISQDPTEVLTCLGLGSCVGVCMHDPVAKVAGMAHIVLPDSEGNSDKTGGKYADIGIPLLLKKMLDCGAIKSRIIVKMAGGSQISRAKGLGDVFQIGERNIGAVQSAFQTNSMRIKVSDTGGASRTYHAISPGYRTNPGDQCR